MLPRSKHPFDLDIAVATWRRRFEHDRSFLPEDIRELEQHVRDHVEALVETGHSPEEAFRRVMQEMGEPFPGKPPLIRDRHAEELRYDRLSHRTPTSISIPPFEMVCLPGA